MLRYRISRVTGVILRESYTDLGWNYCQTQIRPVDNVWDEGSISVTSRFGTKSCRSLTANTREERECLVSLNNICPFMVECTKLPLTGHFLHKFICYDCLVKWKIYLAEGTKIVRFIPVSYTYSITRNNLPGRKSHFIPMTSAMKM